jgi:hypothetical protein
LLTKQEAVENLRFSTKNASIIGQKCTVDISIAVSITAGISTGERHSIVRP